MEKECKITLEKFFEKIGLYEYGSQALRQEDKDFYNLVLDKLFQNLSQSKVSARTVAMYFLEHLSKKTNISVADYLTQTQCSILVQ